MCTVSFIPKSLNDFILVSNRDESPNRETFPPKRFSEHGIDCIFPKDAVAGGTWIGISGLQRMVCLLNGGFKPHDPFAQYGKSRGLIVREVLWTDSAQVYLETTPMPKVEPFTLILVDYGNGLKLTEFVWDGQQKHLRELPNSPTIWSSRQLYTAKIAAKREDWFQDFLNLNPTVSIESLLEFHKTAGEGDPKSDLIMDKGFVKTKSVSAVVKHDNRLTFRYQPVPTGKITIEYL